MKLFVNIKPSKVEAYSKEALNSKVFSSMPFTIGSKKGVSYTGHTCKDSNTIRVVNYHKVRRKVERKKDKKGKSTSKVIKPGHWIGYVYDFPIDLLILSGYKKITQKTRNFVIEKK